VQQLEAALDSLAVDTAFSGVVRVDVGGACALAKAYGLADRAHGLPNEVATRFATASAAKGFTALAVMSVVEEGKLELAATARSLLGDDLPLIPADVTVEHLLAHRSGIGDYLDEDAGWEIDDYVLPVPVHRLDSAEAYLQVLDGFPPVFPAGERFAYNNGGYVVLALLAERASGTPYHELVQRRVCEPAGMHETAFLRSDELPADVAVGYLSKSSPRTNIFHLPVLGVGDGGIHSTLADVHSFWGALFEGRIVSRETVEAMVRPRSDADGKRRYGLGFWLGGSTDEVALEGYDAGVSFRSVHDPSAARTWTVIANTSEGAWPLVRLLEERAPRG
jgi:CubicO group peptidase (beta-lactamase class C family)